jgi:hypothetical protein
MRFQDLALHMSIHAPCTSWWTYMHVFLSPLCFQITNFVHLNFPSDIRNLSSNMSFCNLSNNIRWKCFFPSILSHLGIVLLSVGSKLMFDLSRVRRDPQFLDFFPPRYIHQYSIVVNGSLIGNVK